MSTVVVKPGTLMGAVTPPASKSQLHRIMIAQMLSGSPLRPASGEEGADLAATRRCLSALWAGKKGELPRLDCGQSGSTLRFLIPVALLLRGGGVFTGEGRLMERPLQPYLDLFEEKGIRWNREGNTLTLEGRLEAGDYRLPGDVSSQFITGLLFVLPRLEGDSRISLTTPLESRPYVDMTIAVLGHFGIRVRQEAEGYFIPGNQCYQVAQHLRPESDWSQGAFWYAANFLDSQVKISGLNPQSVQGDRQIGLWYWTLARPGEAVLDLSQNPDLLPAAALMAAFRVGETRLIHAARLRDKESDRLSAVAQVLNLLGAETEELPDGLILHGPCELQGGVTVDCRGDHRIAMMAAIAATKCALPVTIPDVECVEKSYPAFWDHFRQLGGRLDVLVSG